MVGREDLPRAVQAVSAACCVQCLQVTLEERKYLKETCECLDGSLVSLETSHVLVLEQTG